MKNKVSEQQAILDKHLKVASRELLSALRLISSLDISNAEKRKLGRKLQPAIDQVSRLKFVIPENQEVQDVRRKQVRKESSVRRR